MLQPRTKALICTRGKRNNLNIRERREEGRNERDVCARAVSYCRESSVVLRECEFRAENGETRWISAHRSPTRQILRAPARVYGAETGAAAGVVWFGASIYTARARMNIYFCGMGFCSRKGKKAARASRFYSKRWLRYEHLRENYCTAERRKIEFNCRWSFSIPRTLKRKKKLM